MNTGVFFTGLMRVTTTLVLGLAAALPSVALADNPIVQTNYTADPAPMVYEDRLYVYTTHDEDVTVNNFFTMNDWRVYSTVDMVNWTDHGSPLSYKSFTWGTGDAWAGQCIPRNGKFYFYVPMNNGSNKIGVAVGDTPIGPFKDALGKPLLGGGGYIDPTVFIDDDGQAYLYWGNPDLAYVKLNSDMISFQGSATKVSLTTSGFGTRSNTDRATAYEEGPWFYKRNALYYIVYPADGVPEKISYTTSSGPLGPWSYRGDIMAKESGAGSSFTNHPGVVDFKGKSYFFYHNGALPGGGGYKRSVCVEEFSYGADGSIPTIKMTTAGPSPVANLNPFTRTEAETIAFSSGLKTEVCTDTGGGMNVTSISNGDYIKVRSVDFGTGATSFEARVAATSGGGSIELRLDSATASPVATCAIASTGGAQTWATQTCTVSGLSGLHDLYMKFTGGSGDLFKFNYWRFIPRDALPDAGVPDAGARDTAGDSGTGAGGAGAGTGGATAAGGSAGGAGGTGGTSGSGGSMAATGGAGGGAVAGSGGTRTGGASGTGGAQAGGGTRGGSGGASGGTTTVGSGGGGAGGTGGTTGSGGASTTGGSSVTDQNPPGGCSCRSTPGGHSGHLVIGLLLLALLHRRRGMGAR
jgi:arabinoxylan arabinofuranohydrolase